MNQFLLPGNAPFVAAIGLMLAIGALEGITLLFGLSLTEHAGSLLAGHFGLGHPNVAAETGVVGQLLGWLHLGRVPFLILLILFLLGFAIVGLVLQALLHVLAGFMLPPAMAALLAAPGALLFVRQTGGVVGRLLPQNETSALSEADFIGRTAQIVTGEASQGNPAEARLVDEYGQQHYLRVEPDDADARFARGSTVLIVARVSGSLYRGIANPRPGLL